VTCDVDDPRLIETLTVEKRQQFLLHKRFKFIWGDGGSTGSSPQGTGYYYTLSVQEAGDMSYSKAATASKEALNLCKSHVNLLRVAELE